MADVSATDVGQYYIELHLRLKRLVDEAMTASGLSLSRAKVLMQLRDHGSMKQSALADRLGFAPRSVTDTVDTLERDGLAERSDDPSDRRARIVTITSDGTAALDKAVAAKHRIFDRIFGGLDSAGRTRLFELLQQIDRTACPQLNTGVTCGNTATHDH